MPRTRRTLVSIDKEVRREHVDRTYAEIFDKIEYLVMVTATGMSRNHLTDARMYLLMAQEAYRAKDNT